MPTPVKTFGEYVFCFDAEAEALSARTHFIHECGWSESEYRKIANCAWFCARVSVWKDGEELASSYLGACSYKTERQFYTTYQGDYFADMVIECAEETEDPDLITQVKAWHACLRAAQEKRVAAKQARKARKKG